MARCQRGDEACGLRPPKALEALAEFGIQPMSMSKQADEFREVDFDRIVTVCDSAAAEGPIWLGKGKKVHHRFPDPALTDAMDNFRAVRDDIERVMLGLLKEA